MNITIVGGGNIGTAMCSYIKETDEHFITIKTSKPERWSKTITYVDKESGAAHDFELDCITSDPETAFANADIIVMTLPSFMIGDAIDEMEPFVKPGTMVGVVPGSGGCEFYCQELIDRGVIFFGFDRVPCVSRLETYGRKVVASKKAKTRAVAIPNSQSQRVAETFANVLHMEIEPLKNYLTVTFTPSNPIVHTSRLFAMFNDITPETHIPDQILFYGAWDDVSSKTMLDCDAELHKICDALDELDLTGVIPLSTHYEIDSVEGLTRKIRSIESMNAILSPLVKVGDDYRIDLGSRYFIEDFPFGLCILKGFAEIAGVEVPTMDAILRWYEKLGNKEYFVDGKFCGKDLAATAIPQNFGIHTKEDVYRLYK